MHAVLNIIVILMRIIISQVMVYSGQLDVIIAFPQTEAFLNALDWSGKYIYAMAPRKIWRVNNDVAGN